tara:strand:+ start:586 stop:765 length:180 start_codon:yes stop_codon:yes gene_type:complete
VEEYARSLIRKHHKLGNQIAHGHDNSEQVRELRELQRSLAERIRKIQRGTYYRQTSETA